MRSYMLIASMFVASSAFAAVNDVPVRDSTISVVGTSTLKLVPDQVTVPVTITTEDADLSKAKELNDKKVKKIVSLAEKFGAEKDDVRTTYHSVEPQMSYGNNVTVEVEVYTSNINYTMDVRGLSQEKIDALSEALQKTEVSNVNFSKNENYASISANFNTSNEKQEAVRDKIKANQEAVLKIATSNGVARDKVGVNTNNGKGKETRSQPYKQHIEKYKAVVALEVVLKDKDNAVDFVNATLKEGVENVGSIQFSLKDEKSAQDKASLEALKDAKRKAQAIADAMSVVIDKPLSISANDSQVIPVQPYAMNMARREMGYAMDAAKAVSSMQAVAEPGALPTGKIEVRANVSATFLLKQK